MQSLDGRLSEFLDWIDRFPWPIGIKEAVRQRRMKSGAWAIDLGDGEREEMQRFLAWFEPWLAAVRDESIGKTGRQSGR